MEIRIYRIYCNSDTHRHLSYNLASMLQKLYQKPQRESVWNCHTEMPTKGTPSHRLHKTTCKL